MSDIQVSPSPFLSRKKNKDLFSSLGQETPKCPTCGGKTSSNALYVWCACPPCEWSANKFGTKAAPLPGGGRAAYEQEVTAKRGELKPPEVEDVIDKPAKKPGTTELLHEALNKYETQARQTPAPQPPKVGTTDLLDTA